jgi:hypothetical protein
MDCSSASTDPFIVQWKWGCAATPGVFIGYASYISKHTIFMYCVRLFILFYAHAETLSFIHHLYFGLYSLHTLKLAVCTVRLYSR